MPVAPGADPRRILPSVEQALRTPALRTLADAHGRGAVIGALREALAALRLQALRNPAAVEPALATLAADVGERLARRSQPTLRRVINATGVIVHTNLGRAPLSAEAAAHAADVAAGYSNLEYGLDTGGRGQRESHVEPRLCGLLGAEAALVVNNCAAAVLLAVGTLAEGREVVVSRGELVEIGGSFRIPDVIRKSGARLREVGTTNRTRTSDYKQALSTETALILKVHPSNFRVVGFTEEAPLAELAALAGDAGLPLMQDLGSGLLDPLPDPLASEQTARQAFAAGAHVLTFSGDKLLGGPQAGIVAGRRTFVDAMRRNALYRALRPDKMALAALDATLVEHESGRANERLPVLRMVHSTREDLRRRAEALVASLLGHSPRLRPMAVDSESVVGGGAAPAVGLPGAVVTLDPGAAGADRMATALRAGSPPVVVRVAEDRLVIDLRTVAPDEEPMLVEAILRAAGA